MFCNVPPFLVKSAFCIKFMASLLLILQIKQQKLRILMFKIVISLRYTDIINESWHHVQAFG